MAVVVQMRILEEEQLHVGMELATSIFDEKEQDETAGRVGVLETSLC